MGNIYQMIVFIFLGHSNMAGSCAEMDTIPHERVWSYNARRGYYHCTDRDISNNSGSPMMPFLKAMANQYPKYDFCGIKLAGPCRHASHVLEEGRHREALENEIAWFKGKAVFGGAMLNFGILECRDGVASKSFGENLITLIEFLREKTEVPGLPILLCRLEKNGPERMPEYQRHEGLIESTIGGIQYRVSGLAVIPFIDIPAKYYCDPEADVQKPHDYHHYSKEGYEILGRDGTKAIQLNNFDFWNNPTASGQ